MSITDGEMGLERISEVMITSGNTPRMPVCAGTNLAIADHQQEEGDHPWVVTNKLKLVRIFDLTLFLWANRD